jgi:ribosome biogenesis GTPase
MGYNIGVRGQVVDVAKTGYGVNMEGTRIFCIINNSFRGESPPVVGDWVDLSQVEDQFFIIDFNERKNFLGRYDPYKNRVQGLAANVDWMIVVTSANREFSVNRINRFFTLAGQQQINLAIILTKVDLCRDVKTFTKDLEDEFPDVPIIKMNALTTKEVHKIYDLVGEGESVLLVGSSGVGKTTIINTMTGLQLRTLPTKTGKFQDHGKHTTSARTLYPTDNGRKVIDIPGIKIVEPIPENMNYIKTTRKERFR